ncbi:hypothetical protein MMC26_000141 [Xylographa opegraphella]|nr:hypothetical protein [Xylographa opegraphella]
MLNLLHQARKMQAQERHEKALRQAHASNAPPHRSRHPSSAWPKHAPLRGRNKAAYNAAAHDAAEAEGADEAPDLHLDGKSGGSEGGSHATRHGGEHTKHGTHRGGGGSHLFRGAGAAPRPTVYRRPMPVRGRGAHGGGA